MYVGLCGLMRGPGLVVEYLHHLVGAESCSSPKNLCNRGDLTCVRAWQWRMKCDRDFKVGVAEQVRHGLAFSSTVGVCEGYLCINSWALVVALCIYSGSRPMCHIGCMLEMLSREQAWRLR